AGAGAARVGVVDGEALLVDLVGEVDGGPVEVGGAHPVHDHLEPLELGEQVAVEGALVEVELVDEAGAAARLDADPQPEVVATLLVQQALGLLRGNRRQHHAVAGGGGGLGAGVLKAHLVLPVLSGVLLSWPTPSVRRPVPTPRVRPRRGGSPRAPWFVAWPVRGRRAQGGQAPARAVRTSAP